MTKIPLLLSIILLSAGLVGAAEPKLKDFLAAVEKASKLQRETIRAEVKQLGDHAWAGEYYMGDGLGANTSVCLAPAVE